MYVKALLSLLFFLFPIISQSQALQWAKAVGGVQNDQSTRSVVDATGNLYIVGSLRGSNVDFDPGPGIFLLSSAGQKDGFVAKYDQTGAFKWAFTIGGTNQDDVEDIALDNSGNLVISGYFRGSNVDFDPSAATALLNSNGESGGDPGYGGDIFVAKYDNLGNYKWAFNVGGNQIGDNATGIDVDNSDNVLITGYFNSSVDFDPSAATNNLNSSNGVIYIAKYNANGQYVWAINTGQGFSDNAGFDVIADNQNNVIATGYFQGTNIDFDPSAGTALFSSNGGFEFFVAKYNPSGQYLWAKTAGGAGADVGRSLIVDTNNDVYVTGDYNSSTINFNPGQAANLQTNKGGNDLFLVKYSAAGQHIWSFATGGSGSEFGLGIDTDNQNNILITGAFTGVNTDFDPSPNAINLSSAGGNDIYAVKYSPAGLYLCSFRAGGAGDDVGRDIATFGNFSYITGVFNNSNVDFDPTAGTISISSSAEDAFFSKYDWTIVPPAGTLAGMSNCATGLSQLTFTATSGTAPFSLHISNGTTTSVYNNIQSGVPFSLSSSPTSPTTYTLTGVKDANLCSAVTPANSSVLISPASLPVTTSGDVSICRFDSVQLSAAGGVTYQWSPATGLNDPFSPNPKASPALTTTYKVIVTNGAGCKDSTTLTVTLKPSPSIVVLPASASFCEGDSVQLTASGGSIYQWMPSTGLSDPSIANPKASPPGTATYKLVVTNSGGCKDSLTKTVTKNLPPTVSLDAGGAICPGDSLQLNASGGTSYQWLPANGLNNAFVANPKASPSITTTYKAIVTNAPGCKDSATTTIIVKPKPVVAVSQPTAICKGDTVQLNATGGVSYIWSPVSTLNNSTVANPKAFPAITTTYKVIGTGLNNCVDSATAIVTVNQPPLISLTANTSVCIGDSVQLSAGGGNTYQWFPAVGLSNQSTASPKASPSQTTTYKVLVYSAPNCVDSAFATVVVKPKPAIVVTPSSILCKGDTMQLNATGGNTYQWFPATGLSNPLLASPDAYPATSTAYKVIVTNSDGCRDSAGTLITITPKAKPNLGNDTVICLQEDILLDATIAAGTNYLWNNGATTPAITVEQPGIYTVSVDVTGCKSPSADTVQISNLPLPTVQLGKDTMICNFYTLKLSAIGENIERYFWNTGSTDSFVLVNQAGNYSVTVNNRCGDTTDAIVVAIDICADDLFFPSAFTPNSDKRNDIYKAGYFQGFLVFDYELQVFNRWGERVFITNDVNKGWNGLVNGKEQPTGIFVWLAKYRRSANGPLIVKRGTAALIR